MHWPHRQTTGSTLATSPPQPLPVTRELVLPYAVSPEVRPTGNPRKEIALMKSSLLSLLAGSLVVAMPSYGTAQTTLAPASETAAAPAPQSPADEAFEPLRRDMDNLHRSLRNQGGVSKDDHAILGKMRDRAAAFSKQFPADNRGLAIELTIAGWLKEDELVDNIYQRLLKNDPTNMDMRFGFANRLRQSNRYQEALATLNEVTIDPAKNPEAVLLKSDALFADEKFQESLDVLNTIPNDAIKANALVEFQVDQARRIRNEYIEWWPREQELRAAAQSADDLPRVKIVTDRGEIIVELFENEAPNTVANFISLADKQFYDTTKFHQVRGNDRITGGDPNTKPGATGTPGQGDAGYLLPDEHERPDRRNHYAGSIGMVRTNTANSGSSQFYLTVAPNATLNGRNTVFGRVIEGLDVVRAIKQDDVIQSVTVIRKKSSEYVPTTLPLPGTATATTQPLNIGAPGSSSSGVSTETPSENPLVNPSTTQPIEGGSGGQR